ncbi:unnamed protein product [Phytophthora fragariaefolia]|uniref:Unnamed protein product n=1 Tax=Phytophthora fragariaefolia TaxID=1490495 RepID=A0A9W7DDN8_9STRA|nr:unnamed protein product [Phytophthora fragariaefolia]
MVSYRRQGGASRSNQEGISATSAPHVENTIKLEEMVRNRPSEYRIASPVPPSTPPLLPEYYYSYSLPDLAVIQFAGGGADTSMTADQTKDTNPRSTMAESDRSGGPPHLGCPMCGVPLTLQSHAPQLQMFDLVKSLLLLKTFVLAAPLEAFSFYSGEIDSRIRRQWLSDLSAVRRNIDESPASSMVTEMVSALSLTNLIAERGDITVGAVYTTLEKEVLRTSADLLLDSFSSSRIHMILVSIPQVGRAHQHGQTEATPFELCGQFSQSIVGIFNELTRLLTRSTGNFNRSRSGRSMDYTSIPALVDDILSLIYSEPRYQKLRGQTSALLLRKDNLLEVGIQQLFQVFVSQTLQYTSSGVDSPSNGERNTGVSSLPDVWTRSSSWWQGIGSSGKPLSIELNSPRTRRLWCQRWFLDLNSLSVVCRRAPIGSGTSSTRSCTPSILSTLFLVRTLGIIDIMLEGRRLIIDSAISKAILGEPVRSSIALELDGQDHSLEQLPSILVSAAGLALTSELWGTTRYKGIVADNRVSLEMCLPSLQASNKSGDLYSIGYDVIAHVTLVLKSATDAYRSNLDVRAEVFTAHLPSLQVHPSTLQRYNHEALSEIEMLPMVEVTATYATYPEAV